MECPDYQYVPGYNINFQNMSVLSFQLQHTYTFLLFDFDPTNSPPEEGAVKLPAFTGYTCTNGSVTF